jgi:very-short-patch-repair endonuclease
MISDIYLNGSMLIKIEKIGRSNIYYLDSGETLVGKKSIKKVEAECYRCKNKRVLNSLNDYNLKNQTLCSKCKSVGESNSFYGKKHKKKSKQKISKQNRGKLSGEKNPMFGKSVFEHWVDTYGIEEANKKNYTRSLRLSKANSGSNNPMYQKTITEDQKKKQKESYSKYLKNRCEEEKEKISLATSRSQKKLYQSDPEKYRQQRRKAGKLSHIANGKYKKNKLETQVSEQLDKMGLNNFDYSIILGGYQFDFGCKKHKLLLEVQGDYWHGNSRIYTMLNPIQENIKQKDKLKAAFALKHGFKLFYIWESEINNNDFAILNQIKELIDEI